MKNVIEHRDYKIESLKETIKLLKNKGKVNKLNYELKNENKTLRNENKSLNEKVCEQLKKNNELLSIREEYYRYENTELVQKNKSLSNRNKALSEKNEKLGREHATLFTYCNIIKAKISSYFRKLNNIEGDEDTHYLPQWIVDEDLERKHEDDNQEAVKQPNEETKSDIIEIEKEEQKVNEQSDEINNSECLKILQYIHNILEKVGCKFERDITFIQLQAISKIIFNKEICIDEEYGDDKKMSLDVDNPDDIKLMKLLSKYRILDLEDLTIRQIDCNNEKIVGLFIENSFPTSLEYLALCWSSKEELICNLLPSISIAVSKVSENVDIWNVTINKEDFEQLLLACNSGEISFFSCVINLPSAPDLSSVYKSNIRGLHFNFEVIDVKPDVRWFELLVEGISKSKGIADSLKDICLDDCDIKKEEAQEVIQKFWMTRVKVRVI